jgi:hypothetical protein
MLWRYVKNGSDLLPFGIIGGIRALVYLEASAKVIRPIQRLKTRCDGSHQTAYTMLAMAPSANCALSSRPLEITYFAGLARIFFAAKRKRLWPELSSSKSSNSWYTALEASRCRVKRQ